MGRPPFPSGPFGRGPRSTPGTTVLAIQAAPDTPSTPSPATGSTAYYTLLSWVSARATNFDVYLDTVNPPLTIVNPQMQSTSYIPTLLPATTYYWKIVAFNAGGSATGPVWSFTTPSATAVLFSLAGSIVTSQARFGTLSIHDVLGASPNTASLTFDTAPTAGEAISIGLGTLDDVNLIFGGEIQLVDQTYIGTADASTIYPVTLIDHTFRLNKRRPFGTWVSVSASMIARALVAQYAPGFTTHGVQDGLVAVSINFDGSQDFMTCLRALATAISTDTVVGKTTVTYARDVQLFLTSPDTVTPNPIDLGHPPLNVPSPILFSVDHSQLRTRVYGKGATSSVPTDLAVGETILPVADASQFTAAGGQAIAGTTSGGALTQILTYQGVQLGGGGSLVGPGAAPSVAPRLALVVGLGLGTGVYQYAYTDVTAAGESLPSPVGTITTGLFGAPGALIPGAPSVGGSLGTGVYQYAYTDVTADGETLPSPLVSVTTTAAISPPSAPTFLQSFAGNKLVGTYTYAVTFVTALGETLPSPLLTLTTGSVSALQISLPIGPAGVTGRKLYRTVQGGSQLKLTYTSPDNTAVAYNDGTPDGSLGANAPVANTTGRNAVALSAIATGQSGTTGRNVYRTIAGGSQLKFLVALADNTTTTYTDTLADGSLGANAPTVGTAAASQVSLAGIAIGASPTTGRNVYRTTVGGSQLKLLATIADNTTTTYADSSADGSLGANAPTSDTSGLPGNPSGQVLMGATTLLTASAGPFQANGGWVILAGGQAVRYTGISGNTLTGIPISGPGSITTTVIYGSQALPSPALTGINAWNGLSLAMAKGSSVAIWVQRDDLAAQTALGLLELDTNGNPTDGIREYTITDTRRSEPSLTALCDADLALFSRPIVSADYYTRDINTRAGRSVSINLTTGMFDAATFDPATFDDVTGYGETGVFVIQDVTITFDGPALNPLYQVKAASVAFTLGDLLRKVALNG